MSSILHRRNKILIARNKGTGNEDISLLLKRNDLEVLMASSGQEAMSLMKDHPDFRMAVLSADLEGLNGFDTTLLARSLNPNLPIILLVNYSTRETINLAAMVGCDQVLQNPIEPKTFEVLLDKFLSPVLHD
jgi:CheY-like chemotaxis protein